MTVKATIAHIADNTKQVFVDFKNDVGDAMKKFKAAPGREKVWVLIKTFSVAVACGLIAFGTAFLLGSFSPAPLVAGFVIGGVYAFYRFSRSARGLDQLALDQAKKDVKQAAKNVKEAAKEVKEGIVNAGEKAADVVKNAGEKVVNVAKNLKNAVKDKVNKKD